MPRSAFTDAYRSLVEFLRTTRTVAGISQAELAGRLGRPQQWVSFVELGERRIDVVEFYAIMRALEVDPVEAFAELARHLPEKVDI